MRWYQRIKAETISLTAMAVIFLAFVGADLIPLALIRISNKTVFPSTVEMANGMLWISLIASIVALLVACSARADWVVRIVAILGIFGLGAVNWWQLSGHWQLAREVDSAKAAMETARQEREEASRLADQQTERELRLSQARTQELNSATALQDKVIRSNDSETRKAKAFKSMGVVIAPKKNTFDLPAPQTIGPRDLAINPLDIKAKITDEEVRNRWMPSLTWRAKVEAGVAIAILVLLVGIWHLGEIDFDNDGIAQRLNRLPKSTLARLYPDTYRKLYGELPSPYINASSQSETLARGAKSGN